MIEPNVAGGLIGGSLIGISSLLMLLLLGRITGISGILTGIITWNKTDGLPWRAAFIGGLILGAVLYQIIFGRPLPLQMQADGVMLVLAGLLVGMGTRLGSGCTSGHGVCGIARRSPRSIVSTVTFMAVAVITVYLTRHVLA
ncbi:MAG: YeeE/YedE family protein [Pseudomonadales bacterium]|nr:YeeE/YedE family protein [Pseudomonadales bacterium]MCP5329726.1 YeeE/YedE family protein [Pseudomonadales bacterium]MCP5343735.1 YeeE/YedE family protein [Pseudomonadales bacterium]